MSSVRRRRPRPAPLRWASAGTGSVSECNTDSDLCSYSTSTTKSTVLFGNNYSPVPSTPTRTPSASRSTSPCVSPRGNLAYLASRRSSRDSQGTSGGDTSPTPSASGFQQQQPNSRRPWQRRQSNFLELPVVNHIKPKPRVCSLPEGYNPRCGTLDDIYRLRTFSITNKGVVNTGDSLIPRRSNSNLSMNSTNTNTNSKQSGQSGERSPFEGSCCGSSAVSTDDEGGGEENKQEKYRIVLLGSSGVGKSALVHQFMTSEYINTYDVSLDDEFGERTVSVLLDSLESEMVFIDHPSNEMSVENSVSTYEPHATIVVFSVTDRSTYRNATDILRYLWQEGITGRKAVILVGNKCDLARARTVKTQEGKSLACAYDCKFIETSSGIQHNVDELLVGILKQCRLREEKNKKEEKNNKKERKLGSSFSRNAQKELHSSRTSLSLQIAKEILGKLCLQNNKSKSCENLHVL